MFGAIVWLVLCVIMGYQANHVGLSFGFWLFTIAFVGLCMGPSRKSTNTEIQDIYWRKIRQERKEAKDKKGTIGYTEKKR